MIKGLNGGLNYVVDGSYETDFLGPKHDIFINYCAAHIDKDPTGDKYNFDLFEKSQEQAVITGIRVIFQDEANNYLSLPKLKELSFSIPFHRNVFGTTLPIASSAK